MILKPILAAVISAALLVPNIGYAQVSVAERLAPGQPPVVAATGRIRGIGYPDDSLANIRWAIKRGVDMVVMPIRFTRDGQYIVMNEGTLTRNTNVRDVYPNGPPSREPGDPVAAMHIVTDYTLEEIKRLRLLDPQSGDHQVPTLEEALDLIDRRMIVGLDLRAYDVESLAALLETRDTEHLLLFDGGDERKLRDITTATGIGAWEAVKSAQNPTEALDKRADTFGPDLVIVDVDAAQLTPELVARAEELGVRLFVIGRMEDVALGGGNAKLWIDALDKPAAAFMTEHPNAVLELLGR